MRNADDFYDLERLIKANVGTRPVFINRVLPPSQMTWSNYKVIPYGLLFAVVPEAHGIALPQFVGSTDKCFAQLDGQFEARKHRPGSWEEIACIAWCDGKEQRAKVLVEHASGANEKQLLESAARDLELINRTHPKPPLVYLKSLGLIYHRLTRFDSKHEKSMRNHWQRYIILVPSDPDAARIAKIINHAP